MKPEKPSHLSPKFVSSSSKLGELLTQETAVASGLKSLKAIFAPRPHLFIYDPARGHVATQVSETGFHKLMVLGASERNLDRARRILQAAGFNHEAIAAIEPGDRVCLAKLLGSGELSVDWLRENWQAMHAGEPDVLEVGLALGQSYTFARQQEQAGIQDFSRAWHTETARRLASCLIKGNGSVDGDAIAVAIEQLQRDFHRTQLPRGPYAERLARVLARLGDAAALRARLESIKGPAPAAADFVRATLGLSPTVAVTDTDARRAVLAALLAELRQDAVGSCFATSLAIKVHDEKPDQLLSDLKALLEDGKLTRTLHLGHDARATADFPLNPSIGLEELQQPFAADAKGRVVSMGNLNFSKPLAPREIPGLRAALGVLGLTTSAAMKGAIREAHQALGGKPLCMRS